MNMFIKRSCVVALFLALGAVAVPTPARAADGKGALKGKVLKADGNPAGGAEVVLVARAERRAKTDANATKESTEKPKAKRERREPAAQVKADDHGTFTINDLPVGQYFLAVRLKGEGAARQRVTVHAGDASEVTLKLQSVEERRKTAAANETTRAQRRQARLERLERKHARALEQAEAK